jgi:hypothetical protein
MYGTPTVLSSYNFSNYDEGMTICFKALLDMWQ